MRYIVICLAVILAQSLLAAETNRLIPSDIACISASSEAVTVNLADLCVRQLFDET